MKRLNNYRTIFTLIAALTIILSGCERELSDEAVLPSFDSTPDIFTDDFIGLGADFYFPFADAKPDVFSVDASEGFESNVSIRIDVPNASDPTGSYAGAIFRIDGPGRNLTQYNALTFYTKASQGVSLGDAGFGLDFEGDKFRVATNNINVGTSWSKVIIPIPDASKLLQERGMFWFAAGSQGTGGAGYVIWFDEIKFETLDNLDSSRATIYDGQTTSVQAFVGSTLEVTGLNTTYSFTDAPDIVVAGAPSYYEFSSSDTAVASVDELGLVSVKSNGTADITATLAGEPAEGKLEIGSSGGLPTAPTPIHPQSDVLSLFSDAYTPAATINYAPGFGGSTTVTTLLQTGNSEVLDYKTNNYTGIMWDETPLNGSTMSFLHVDVYVQNAGGTVGIQIRDIGGNTMLETDVNTGFPKGDDKDYRQNLTGFTAGAWKSFEIPLGGDIASQKSNLGALIITGGPDFILDNIYFYKQ